MIFERARLGAPAIFYWIVLFVPMSLTVGQIMGNTAVRLLYTPPDGSVTFPHKVRRAWNYGSPPFSSISFGVFEEGLI